MISIDVDEIPDSKWNNRLLSSGLGTIYQTKEMKINYERQGQKPFFLKFINTKGNIIGQLILRESSRFAKKGAAGSALKKIPGMKKLVYIWNYGPVIFDQEADVDVYLSLEKFLIEKGCKVSGWTHPFFPGNATILSKNFNIQKWGTFIINLQKPKDEIYQKIEKHNGRKNIERSLKRGVEIEEINEKSLLEYTELRNKMNDSQEEDYKKMLQWWRLLKPLGYSGFLARKDGKAIGGLLFSYFDKFIIEGGVARSSEDTTKKLYAQDLIKWKIIEWGVENRMKFYNLAGFNPKPTSKKEEGIFRYKKKWGGDIYNYWHINR